ncbi:MAG: hypothetical protein WEA56_16915 [Balneolaceae bacterium]
MKYNSAIYQLFTKSFAIILLAGFLLPAGLHAKQLVEFCMTEMHSHEMMDSSHDCCDSEEEKQPESTHGHHDCDGILICACSADVAPLSKENGIPVSPSFAVVLESITGNYSAFSFDEPVRSDLQIRIGQHDPPLWLLYDTFLM